MGTLLFTPNFVIDAPIKRARTSESFFGSGRVLSKYLTQHLVSRSIRCKNPRNVDSQQPKNQLYRVRQLTNTVVIT